MKINLEPPDRIALVQGLFSRAAPRYDLLNHVMSLRRDVFWRRAAARRTKAFETGRILDLAAGTGDLTLALAEARPEAHVVGADFTQAMLDLAQKKVQDQGRTGKVSLVGADGLRLPFPDRSFDSVTMAFGIRNIPDPQAALKEMFRILVPRGRAVILELTFPRWSIVRRAYDLYLNRLIPRLGGMISGQTMAYQYLADSIMDFPSPEKFLNIMAQAGFHRVRFLRLTFGVAALHWGERPEPGEL